MNKTETAKIMKYLKGAYTSLCRSWTDEDWQDTTAVWSDLFSDIPVNNVYAATKRHVEKGSPFFPSAPELFSIAKDITEQIPPEEMARLLDVPKSKDGKCPYGLCDGSGFYKWQRQMYGTGVDYEILEICPCEWDRRIADAVKNEQAHRLDALEQEKIKHRSRLERIHGLEATIF